ncbi:MAG: helix-turn-helix domain-containing protein [Proteobacteria bacterium]|nr:helix-turn-helix domain-containing protein [Pseudomonadota bacterium]
MASYQAEPGGLGDKFRLLYTVACDERASRSHVAVIGVLLWRFNRDHGCCWPSVDSMAVDGGLDERTVQRAIDALEEWGYLHVNRQRGKLNRYVPHFQAQKAPQRDGIRAGGSRGEKGRHPHPKGTASSSKRDDIQIQKGTARTPPEYLNESITESEKEIGSSNSNSFFSGNRNQGNGEAKGANGSDVSQCQFPKGSPESQVVTSLAQLQTLMELKDLSNTDVRERLDRIEGNYRFACEFLEQMEDLRALELIRAQMPGSNP